jgi:hypothetical protein
MVDTAPSHAMRKRIPHQFLGAIVAFIVGNGQTHVHAQSGEELAKQLQNPVASLISVPFQNNFDFVGGYNDQAFRYQLNFQPVIPISIGKDWNLISRTILPFIHRNGYIPADHHGSGTGVCFSHCHAGNPRGGEMGCRTVACRPSAKPWVDLWSAGLPGLVVCRRQPSR